MDPPGWALNFLQNLARYGFGTGNVFADGDWMPTNGPIARAEASALVAIAFAADPELPAIATPFGQVTFLEVVGLTADEVRAARRWKTSALLDVLRPHLPLLVSDVGRASLLDDPALAKTVADGAARDGSWTGFLFTDRLAWTARRRWLGGKDFTITIGAGQVDELASLLPLRLPFGRPLRVAGDDGAAVVFAPGDRNEAAVDEDALTLRLSDDTARALVAALRPEAGNYPVPGWPAVTIHVEDCAVTG